jgi:hypothetical protein
MMKLGYPRSNTNWRSTIALTNIKKHRERCPKATDSKAVGGTQPTALPSSPRPLPCPPCPQTKFGSAVEPRVAIPTFRSVVGGRPVRPAQHSAVKRAWLCFPSNAYCENKRSAGNQLPWSDLCEHLGMRDVSRRSYSVSAVRASRSLESLRTLAARLRCLASRRLG